MDVNITLDSTTWAALALVLALLGAALSWVAWRRRGLAAGLRALAWTLLPIAAWLTGTLKLAAGILDDVVNWAARLVFSPTVWLGVIVAGAAAALWVVSGLMRARGIGVRGEAREVGSTRTKQVPAGKQPAAAPKRAQKSAPKRADKDDIDDMDEIEAILKRHGI
jgi:hypothetical protein